MTMTDEEICRDYRQAKSPVKQIKILAQLNQCDRQRIYQILTDGGCKLPGNCVPKKAADIALPPKPHEDEWDTLPGEEALAKELAEMTNDEKTDIECPVEEEQTVELEKAALSSRYWSAKEVRELLARAFADFVDASCDAVRLSDSEAETEMMNILAAQDYRQTVEKMLNER